MLFNLYENINRAYIHPSVCQEIDFDEFVEIMRESQCWVKNKEDAMMFNLCSWRDDFESPEHHPGFIRRCRQNVSQLYALLLDIDGTKTLDKAVEEYIDYEFLIYSTFGNSVEKEKFRIILPLQTPLTNQEFSQRHRVMCDSFGVDRASFTISQAFYLPCYTDGNQDQAFIEHNRVDQRYEALRLPAEIINENTEVLMAPESPDAVSASIYKTLLTGHNMRYADALPVAVILKSRGFQLRDYQYLVQCIGGQDSSIRTADLKDLWQKAIITNNRYDTIIATMSRLNCDMWRWQVKKNTNKYI